jgi:hypothetical protein
MGQDKARQDEKYIHAQPCSIDDGGGIDRQAPEKLIMEENNTQGEKESDACQRGNYCRKGVLARR